jgi:hypothetical protein
MATPASPKVGRLNRLRTVLFVIAAIFVAAICWYRDFPAIPNSRPVQIEKALYGKRARCYVYSLGGFINREYLWRIDGSPAAIAAVIAELEMEEAKTIPVSFWKMPPYYWPRQLSEGAKPYGSAGFVNEEHGNDGEHYFLLHDTKSNRAYVWFKDNF